MQFEINSHRPHQVSATVWEDVCLSVLENLNSHFIRVYGSFHSQNEFLHSPHTLNNFFLDNKQTQHNCIKYTYLWVEAKAQPLGQVQGYIAISSFSIPNILFLLPIYF